MWRKADRNVRRTSERPIGARRRGVRLGRPLHGLSPSAILGGVELFGAPRGLAQAETALTALRTVATSKFVFEPSPAVVLEAKPGGGPSIAHDEKAVVILKVLFEFVPYLDWRFFRYDEPCRIEAIPVAGSNRFKRRKKFIVIFSFRRVQIIRNHIDGHWLLPNP